MEKINEIIGRLEGVDDAGEPRAIVNVSVQRGSDEDDLELISSYSTMEAVVSMCVSERWISIDLQFDDPFAYDLVQLAQLCGDYENKEREERDKGFLPLSLVVGVTPTGEYDAFVVGRNAFWCIMPMMPGGEIDTLRFIFQREDLAAYELGEAEIEKMMEELQYGE